MDLKIVDGKEDEKKPLFETGWEGRGVTLCHIFKVPHTVANDIQLAKGIARQTLPVHSFIPCIKEQCALWDKESGEDFKCSDLLANKAKVRMANLLKTFLERAKA